MADPDTMRDLSTARAGWTLRAARWAPWAAGVITFAVYAVLAAPTMYWLDAQELGAAAVRLGSPHPTGFPLFVWLGHLGTYVPVGELAFRVHLTTAAWAAVAVGFAVRLTQVLAERDAVGVMASFGAGALVGGSTLFWFHAVTTEVYAPTAAALLGSLLLVARSGARGGSELVRQRAALVLALVFGLAATGLHASYRLALLLPVVLLFLWWLRRGARFPLAAPALAMLGGLGALVLLPLRSASGRIALLDWGHPSTLGGLIDHASAARIRRAYGDDMFQSLETVAPHIADLAGQIERGFGLLGAGCAVLGAIVVVSGPGKRLFGLLLVAVCLLDVLYSVWINPMGLVDGQNGVLLVAVGAVLAGAAMAWLARRLGRAAPFAAGSLAVVVVVPVVLSGAAEKLAIAGSEAPRRFVETGLDACPPGAVALVMSDSMAAGGFWLQTVEQQRPDVAILARQHIAIDPARTQAALARIDRSSLSRGPRCWEPARDGLPRGTALVHGIPMGRLEPAGPSRSFADVGALRARLWHLFRGSDAQDRTAKRAIASGLVDLGRLSLSQRDLDTAEKLFREALTVRPSQSSAHTNLGVVAARRGDMQAAADHTRSALTLDPVDRTALLNLTRYELAAGRDAEARHAAERTTRLHPKSADAWALLGTIEARAGNRDLARQRLERALTLDPNHRDARINLDLLTR